MFCVNCKANKLKKSGGAGYVEPGMVLTFDGNTTGKETFVDADMGFSLVKISNEFYDLSNANKMFLTVRGTGVTEGFTPTVTADPGVAMLDIGGTGSILAISTDGTKEEVSFLSIGTWLFCNDEAYVSRIETAETIHPIDPKFLPGVCLPVVEFSTIPTTEGVSLTEAEVERLNSLADTTDYILVRYTNNDSGLPMCGIFAKVVTDIEYAFSGFIGARMIVVAVGGNEGIAQILV